MSRPPFIKLVGASGINYDYWDLQSPRDASTIQDQPGNYAFLKKLPNGNYLTGRQSQKSTSEPRAHGRRYPRWRSCSCGAHHTRRRAGPTRRGKGSGVGLESGAEHAPPHGGLTFGSKSASSLPKGALLAGMPANLCKMMAFARLMAASVLMLSPFRKWCCTSS